jgi:immune inhibitor A
MAERKGQRNWGKVVLVILVGVMLFSLLPSSDENNNEDFIDDSMVLEEDVNEDDSFVLYDGYTTYPPDPTPFILTQPDGSTFEARNVGEKIGGHMETLDGYSIVEDEEGWWTFAKKDDNGILISSEYRIGKIDPDSIANLPRHLFNDLPEFRELNDNLIPRGTRAPPLNTTWKAIAIMLNFTDRDFNPSRDQAFYSNLLNGTTGSTMRTYFKEVSYGQFDVEVDVVGPFTSTHYMSWYGADKFGLDTGDGASARNIFEMAREAVQLADPTVDFSDYDIDSDGTIDALFVIHAGTGQENGGANNIWSHKSTIFPGEPVDGVWARTYSTEPDEGTMGVFAHEFGHVLGLPDLYDTDYSSSGIGKWGLMASGSRNGGSMSPAHLSAWSKMKLGWVEPIVVTSDISLSSIEIPPVWNNSIVYKMWAHDPSLNTDEYFLIENRQKSGYDTALPGDGLLIWHIDDSQTNNRDETHYLVDLEEADGAQELEAGGASQATDPWENNVTGFRHNTNPNSKSYNGSDTSVWVWNISSILPDKNMTIGFNEINTGPTGIYIEDPVSSVLIDPVYEFILNDTEFPDEDVATSPGNLKIQHSWPGMGIWSDTPFQTLINWTPGVGGVINCTGLPNGTWDFRVKATDEEGHIWYTQVLIDIMILDLAPPIADAGPDFSVGTDIPGVFDASGSSDDSGFIAWYNWTFGDGEIYNGFSPTNATITHTYTTPGFYIATLNVSDAQLNWDTDIVNVTVYDATPPQTDLTITGPKYRENVSHDWNITMDTIFSLSAFDTFSGVNHTWYKIDSDYYEYSIPFDLGGYLEGEHIITWGSEDGVGNNDTGQTITIWVDVSAPSTNYIIGDFHHPDLSIDGVNVTSVTTIYLVPMDNPSHGSGVVLTWFYIDSDYFEGLNFTLNGYGEGAHTITAGSLDNLDHNATGNTIIIWVDDSDPITDIIIDNPKHPQALIDGCNVSNSTQINLLGIDQPAHSSGVNFTWYFIDDDYYVGTVFNLTGYSEGYHNISWGSEDFLFHNETVQKIMVWVDDTPPQTNMSIWQPRHPSFPFDGANVTSTTQIFLSSWDMPINHSAGVDFSWYTIDGDLYIGDSFNLSSYSEGAHIITWGSQDYLGHNETVNEITLWVDDTPPTTILTIGPEKFPDYNDQGCNVTPSAEFVFTAMDYPAHNSSVRYEWFTMNGTWYKGNNFSFSDFGFDEGQFIITWGSIDWLGNNETASEITVYLDRRPPQSDMVITGPSHRDFVYEILNVTNSTEFILNPSDPYSGVAFGWYIIDGEYFEGSNFNLMGYGPGIHTITYGAQDNLSFNKTQDTFDVFMDLTSPNASLVLGQPKFQKTPGDYFIVTGATPFSISAEDASTGVHKIWYIIDGIYYEEDYDIGFIFTLVNAIEGLQTVVWGAYDFVGNNMTGNTTIVWADINSPSTNISISGLSYRKEDPHLWNVTSETLFELEGTDAISGMDFTWYAIDGELFAGTSFNLSNQNPGWHVITWGSKDLIGNNETGNSMDVILDDLHPVTDMDVGEPRYRKSNDHWNVTSQTIFTLSSSDSYSKVDFIWYTIDGVIYIGSEFALSGESQGLHVITYGAQDNLKNNETGNEIIVYLDDMPPISPIILDGPQYKADEEHIWNVTQSTVFRISSSDDYSGVSSIWYTIDGYFYDGSEFRLNGRIDGVHEITWGSSDNLGNEEETQSVKIMLDTSAPVTTIEIGNQVPDISKRFTLNSSTFITLFVEDGMGSGIDFVWFSIDGGLTYLIYEEPFTIPNTTSTINFGAKDNLGNNATTTNLRVLVDDSPPDPDPDQNPNDKTEEKPFAEELTQILTDNFLIIMIVLVVLIILAILLGGRKGKKEEVDFKAEEEIPQVVPMEVIEEEPALEFEEEISDVPPPPPPPPLPPPIPPPPPPE